MIKRLFAVILCASMLTLCACAGEKDKESSTPKTDYPAKALDISLDSCPQKVVSLVPEVTDIIIALGSDAQLAGISDNCVDVRELGRFGDAFAPDISAIKELEPDLVFVSAVTSENDIELLRNAGIPVAAADGAVHYTDLRQLYIDVATLMSGNITGVRNAANTFNNIDAKLKEISNSAGTETTAVIFAADGVTVPPDCFTAELAKFAGISLISADTDSDIATANPQVIICPSELVGTLSARFGNISVAEFDIAMLDRRGADMVASVNALKSAVEQAANQSNPTD
jgi:ABC-type Fe3+-hydroxamate transport system substrate-binding protein